MSANSISGSVSSFPGGSLLDTVSGASFFFPLTQTQSQVDGLVDGFVQQATDLKTLAAISAGGMAYRMGRVGLMGLGSNPAVRALSVAGGLGAEVSAFETVHRSLSTASLNRWSWNGVGGLRQGLLQSFLTFGTLKGAGWLARGQNLIVQHLMQDSAMVLGHQGLGAVGLAPRPSGSLAEQFLHAEATNLQLGAGMALVHGVAPVLSTWERGLDVSASQVFANGKRGGQAPESILPNGLRPALASGFSNGKPAEIPGRGFDIRLAFMTKGRGEGEGGIFERKRQARLFKEEGERLWVEVAEGLIELFASTSLYARKVMWQGVNRLVQRVEDSETASQAPSISKLARLEADFREHPFDYRGQIEKDLVRLQETLGKVATFREKMEGLGFGNRDARKTDFFSAEDLLLFERLRKASGLVESLSEVISPGRFLKDVAERILASQALEDMVAEALPGRYASHEFEFMTVGGGVAAGIGAKEVFRERSKTGAIVDYAGRIRGLSPLSPRLYDRRTFQDLVREYSRTTAARRWLLEDDMKIWNSVFIPAIVVANGGNYREAQKILGAYENQLSRLAPSSVQVTPLTAWWLCRAIKGEGDPLSWSADYDKDPGRDFNHPILELVLHGGRISAQSLAKELGSAGDEAALAHALFGFLRSPYDPKAAMRQALRAPEKVREDALNLTGAFLGAFHGAGVFSPRRLADFKNTRQP